MVLIYLKLIKADYSVALTAAQTAYLATEGAPSVNRLNSPLSSEPLPHLLSHPLQVFSPT
jgi:hypothetical protein